MEEGMRVLASWTSAGYDHGKPCYWPQSEWGKVVKCSNGKVLIEFPTGERRWYREDQIQTEEQFEEYKRKKQLETKDGML